MIAGIDSRHDMPVSGCGERVVGWKYARRTLLAQFQFGQMCDLNVCRAVDSIISIRTPPRVQHGAASDLRQRIRVSPSTHGESLDLLGECMEFGHGPGHSCLFEKVDVVGNRE